MTFTYDMALADPMDQVRFEIGDTVDDTNLILFQDEEINYKLGVMGNDVLMTAAELCDALAIRFARQVDFNIDAQQAKLSQKSMMYSELADKLRAKRAGHPVNMVRVIPQHIPRHNSFEPRRGTFYSDEDAFFPRGW